MTRLYENLVTYQTRILHLYFFLLIFTTFFIFSYIFFVLVFVRWVNISVEIRVIFVTSLLHLILAFVNVYAHIKALLLLKNKDIGILEIHENETETKRKDVTYSILGIKESDTSAIVDVILKRND